MTFSVIIPCHNNSAHIVEALTSVASQQFPAEEVIVVDDASSDDSLRLIKQTGIATKVLQVNARNAAAARNAGITEATGDYVAFLDADNVWLQDHLATAAKLLEDGSSVFCFQPSVVSGRNKPPTDTGNDHPAYPFRNAAHNLNRGDFVKSYLYHGWGFATTGMTVRRERLTEIAGFDVTQPRRHDFEMMMRAIDGRAWCSTPNATWWSRPPREGNISANVSICAYYALRALTLNQPNYDSDDYRILLSRAALNACKQAVYEGDPAQINDAMALARPYLDVRSRVKLAVFTAVPRRWRGRLIRHRRLPGTDRDVA